MAPLDLAAAEQADMQKLAAVVQEAFLPVTKASKLTLEEVICNIETIDGPELKQAVQEAMRTIANATGLDTAHIIRVFKANRDADVNIVPRPAVAALSCESGPWTTLRASLPTGAGRPVSGTSTCSARAFRAGTPARQTAQPQGRPPAHPEGPGESAEESKDECKEEDGYPGRQEKSCDSNPPGGGLSTPQKTPRADPSGSACVAVSAGCLGCAVGYATPSVAGEWGWQLHQPHGPAATARADHFHWTNPQRCQTVSGRYGVIVQHLFGRGRRRAIAAGPAAGAGGHQTARLPHTQGLPSHRKSTNPKSSHF